MACNFANIKQIYFVITRRCNLFCDHCIRSSGPGISDGLSLEDALLALKKLSVFSSAQMLISGGEPSLHKNFVEICKQACEYFPSVNVNTNGLRYNVLKQAYEACNGKLSFQISIDGDEPQHNLIRGAGTYKKTLKSIEQLGKFASITVATTVGDNNINSLSNLDQDLSGLPFDLWTIQKEVVYGRAALASKKITTEVWNKFIKHDVAKFKNYTSIKASTMFDMKKMYQMQKTNTPKSSFCNCGTKNSKFYINPDLTIFPCGCLEDLNLGSIYQDSPAAILENMQKMNIDPKKDSVCSQCPFLQMCNGGCPGASYNYYGEFGHGDPRCPAIRDNTNA